MFLKINSIKEFLCQVIYNFITGKIETGAFPFIFFLSASVGPKTIYISNKLRHGKKYTERNTALEFGGGKGISNLYSTAD